MRILAALVQQHSLGHSSNAPEPCSLPLFSGHWGHRHGASSVPTPPVQWGRRLRSTSLALGAVSVSHPPYNITVIPLQQAVDTYH
jgi:hypothetical protein